MAEILFLPAAEADSHEAIRWYRDRSVQAASGFEVALEKALESIADNPELFALIDECHRWCALKRYPYCVVYRVDGGVVTVIVIAHMRRPSQFWQDRDN